MVPPTKTCFSFPGLVSSAGISNETQMTSGWAWFITSGGSPTKTKLWKPKSWSGLNITNCEHMLLMVQKSQGQGQPPVRCKHTLKILGYLPYQLVNARFLPSTVLWIFMSHANFTSDVLWWVAFLAFSSLKGSGTSPQCPWWEGGGRIVSPWKTTIIKDIGHFA